MCEHSNASQATWHSLQGMQNKEARQKMSTIFARVENFAPQMQSNAQSACQKWNFPKSRIRAVLAPTKSTPRLRCSSFLIPSWIQSALPCWQSLAPARACRQSRNRLRPGGRRRIWPLRRIDSLGRHGCPWNPFGSPWRLMTKNPPQKVAGLVQNTKKHVV